MKLLIWKLYFYFIALVGTFGFLSVNSPNIIGHMINVLLLPAILALHGYLYGKEYFSSSTWKLLFYITLVGASALGGLKIYMYQVNNPNKDILPFAVISLFMFVAINAPSYVAMYRYAQGHKFELSIKK